jgi:hypothetical protein
MLDERQTSILRTKLQSLSLMYRFVIVLVVVFVIYQRINLRDGQKLNQVEKFDYKYNLVEKYEQERLSDNADDPPFKRILYWNDVRYCRLSEISFEIF